MSDLTLVGLRVLVEVAQRGSFTAAADALGYTQSAVSRQIGATESAAGTPLFDRQARGVSLTPAGEALVRHAQGVLARVEAAQLELAGLRDRIAGRLVVGAFPTAAASLIPRTIASLARAHPALVVDVWEAGSPAQMRRLRAGRIEVALIATGDGLPTYDFSGLRTEVLDVSCGLGVAVSASHPLADKGVAHVDDLSNETWVIGAGDEPQFGAWPTLTDPTIGYRVNSWATRLGFVAAGLGVSVLPGLAARTVPHGVAWISVRDPALVQSRQAVLVTAERRSAAASAFVTVLRDELTGL